MYLVTIYEPSKVQAGVEHHEESIPFVTSYFSQDGEVWSDLIQILGLDDVYEPLNWELNIVTKDNTIVVEDAVDDETAIDWDEKYPDFKAAYGYLEITHISIDHNVVQNISITKA